MPKVIFNMYDRFVWTHLLLNKMASILADDISNAFSYTKIIEFPFKFH